MVYSNIIQYIGNDRLISLTRINKDGETIKDIRINNNLDVRILKDLLENPDVIRKPSEGTVKYLANKLQLTEKETYKVISLFENIINKHNLYFDNLNTYKIQSIAQNYALYQMCEIGKSPVNQFEAQASVDGTVGPIKKVGNSSIES